MIPTLLVADHLLVNKFIYRFRIPKRNEIVVFKFPQDRKTDFIKRVIALPGEEVSIEDGKLFVNGESVPDDHAVYSQKSADSRERNMSAFRVPRKGDIIKVDGENSELYRRLIANELGVRVEIMAGQLIVQGRRMDSYEVKNDYLFMMGDNRDNSYDSRFWGPVNTEDIVGKAMIIYWSFGDRFYDVRWGRLGDIIH